MTARFSRRTQLQKYFGDKFAFESIEMSDEAPTMKEAIAKVELEIKEYVAEKKKQIKEAEDLREKNELPFTN